MPAAGVEIGQSVVVLESKGKEESRLRPLTLRPVIIQVGPGGLLAQAARRTYIAQVPSCRWRPIKLIGNNAWQGPGLSAARDTLLQSAAYNAYRDLTFLIVLWDNQLCDSHQ